MAVSTACALTVDDTALAGRFEAEDGATLELRTDGTGALNGYDPDFPELSGTWERHLDNIDFVSELGRTSIQIRSADELWVWANVDSNDKSVFTRTGDEGETTETPTDASSTEEPEALCIELSALLDTAGRFLSDMEADTESGVGGEQVQRNASDLTEYGLRAEALAPAAVAAHARTLADTGTAITDAIENGDSLMEILTLWIASDVLEAHAAVQVYYESESGCGP